MAGKITPLREREEALELAANCGAVPAAVRNLT